MTEENNNHNPNNNSSRRRSLDMNVPPKVEVRHTQEKITVQPVKPKRKILKWILAVLALIIVVLGILAAVRINTLSSAIFVGQKSTFYQKIKDFISGTTGSTKLVGEDLGQVNILILGIGGEGHDGPYLTDSMILAQIRPDIKQMTMASIPRDYLISIPKIGNRKINSAFAEGYNESKDFNTAGLWARQAVEKISGLQIPYFGVLDFKGFEEAIDLVGGVDVNIDRTFTDYTYPDEANGYLPPVTFTAGTEHMNGARALIFARSRHAAGIEGSDFARSQRQEKIMDAFKSKVISLNIISDVSKINNLLSIFATHVHSNISPGEMFRLYSLIKNYNSDAILSLSLDPFTNLICPEILPDSGAYVLSPCPGKTDEDIKNFFKNSFTVGALIKEKGVVWLADSSKNSGLYASAERKLTAVGLTVYKVEYGGLPLDQNVVYQANVKPATLEFIKNTLNATVAISPPPGLKIDPAKVDEVVILGNTSN